jgi:hypothetical protein
MSTILASYATRTDFDALGDASLRTKTGQPFIVSASGKVTAVKVTMQKIGSPADHVSVAIYSDSGGHPGSLLETGSNIDPTSSFTQLTSNFAGTTTLNAGTTYHVVLSRTGSVDGSNYYNWGLDNHSIPYASYERFDGSSWSAPFAGAYNATFEVDGDLLTTGNSNRMTLLGVGH